MAPPVKYRIRDGVAIVTLAAPPSNAISAEVRAGLWDVFGRIETNPDARAAILIAEGGLFSGGGDIRDMGKPEVAPTLAQVCRRIETARLPVVAGLHGAALGAGADLALACHYRLAAADAGIGLPEARLGLIPSGGATQRLPRLVGAGAAIDLMLSGRTLGAAAARAQGLLDGIVAGHLHTGAWSYAKTLADRGEKPRPVSDRREELADGAAFAAQVAERRAAVRDSPFMVRGTVVDCVEAALLLPFEAGCAFEADAAERCRTSDQSAALRHAFIAESRIDDRLLKRVNGTWQTVDPAGTALVGRMREVVGAVAEHLRAGGLAPGLMDKALVDYGFTRTPYGGREGGAGAGGPAIARRFVAALMVEGARQIAEGAVSRAADIDALAIHGAGFPRIHGGPMKACELMGLLRLRRDLDTWAAESPLWETPALLLEAIKTPAGFDGVRRAA